MKAGRAGAGAMLVACRLAGPSALGAHYAGVKWRAIRGRRSAPSGHSGQRADIGSACIGGLLGAVGMGMGMAARFPIGTAQEARGRPFAPFGSLHRVLKCLS